MADTLEFSRKIAKLAVTQMAAQKIPPTPENYAVWYAYAAGRDKGLVKKIDAMVNSSSAFDDEVNEQLYENYISDQAKKGELERHAFSAKTLIQDLFNLTEVMTSETSSYNQELDGYIADLSGKYQDESVTDMVLQLVERTKGVRETGDQLNEKLVESRQEVESLRQNLERLTEEANRDALTGVSNRKAFDAQMAEFSEQAAKGEMDFSLLMVDIDYFKQFNDKFGHMVGDEVLKIVSRELKNVVRGRDMVARYGGEEFAVLLPETPLSGALAVAENLRKGIASKDLTRRDTGQNYGALTVSVGAGQFRQGKDTAKSLIQRTDEALYRSKKGGRNRVTQESSSE